MHFRERDRVVQVIRTRYDAETKRARSEIVVSLDKRAPRIDEALRSRCSAREIQEIQRWIAGAHDTSAEEGPRQRLQLLRQQFERTADWVLGDASQAESQLVLDGLVRQWQRFRRKIRKGGHTVPGVAALRRAPAQPSDRGVDQSPTQPWITQMTASAFRPLHNTGAVVLNDAVSPARRTLIVLGVARGGTSMVAAALEALGVPMGPQLSAVKEDAELAAAMESGDRSALRRLVAVRNAGSPVWGFKRPAAVAYIDQFENEFLNPEYLLVFRDPLAIANRNQLSMSLELGTGLLEAQRDLSQLVAFTGRCQRRMLLTSYEKAINEPGIFVEQLAAFAGIGDPEARAQAVAAIRPGSEEYLRQSRSTGSFGRLDPLRPGRIAGWAALKEQSGPVRVEIHVNGQRVAEVLADRPREMLVKRGVHPTGLCGFELRLPHARRLRPGDEVRARVVGDVLELRHSPAVLQART